jgi:hypothetical protein
MNSLQEMASRVVMVSNNAPVRLPNMQTPLFCTNTGTCVYPDNVSVSKYSICDKNGVCNPMPGCTSSNVYAMDIHECVPLNTPCTPSEVTDSKRTFGYAANGTCSEQEGCIPGWDWTGDKCIYTRAGEKCKPSDSTERVDLVWRYNNEGECLPTRECTSGVYSVHADRCVFPGTVCGQSVAHRVKEYNHLGECVLANRCDANWQLVEQTCQWMDRGRVCKASAEELAEDNKRLFQYDVMGACLPTNMCIDNWDLDPGTNRCVYRFSEQTCHEMNNRIHRYNKEQECVPAECKSGWSLRNDVCVFDRLSQECGRQDEQIYTFSAAGTCEPSGKCIDGNAVMLNGRCYVPRTGCPEGFASQGAECYRVFHLGGEGRSSVSFALNPNDQVRATYNFKKDRQYKDGDFDVSTNFGLNGSRSGIRDQDSISSGWTSGLTQCVLNSRQNDGHATLEVWVK